MREAHRSEVQAVADSRPEGGSADCQRRARRAEGCSLPEEDPPPPGAVVSEDDGSAGRLVDELQRDVLQDEHQTGNPIRNKNSFERFEASRASRSRAALEAV